jgi:phage tail-like protein
VAAARLESYVAFRYLLMFRSRSGQNDVVGGFSDVSGLDDEVQYSVRREPTVLGSPARDTATTVSAHEVTLKRGVIRDSNLSRWLDRSRAGVAEPRTVVIELLDANRQAICRWNLVSTQPRRWTGAALAAKGGGEVAIEELHLAAEQISRVDMTDT